MKIKCISHNAQPKKVAFCIKKFHFHQSYFYKSKNAYIFFSKPDEKITFYDEFKWHEYKILLP